MTSRRKYIEDMKNEIRTSPHPLRLLNSVAMHLFDNRKRYKISFEVISDMMYGLRPILLNRITLAKNQPPEKGEYLLWENAKQTNR